MQLYAQFSAAHADPLKKEAAYVLGRRLYTYIRDAVRPVVHPTELQAILEELALAIDEDQLNLYMDGEMDPVLVDDDDADDGTDDDDDDDDYADYTSTGSWQAFEGWDAVPGGVETDDSSNDIDEVLLVSPLPQSSPRGVSVSLDNNPDGERQHEDSDKLYADPELYMEDDDDDDFGDHHHHHSVDTSDEFLAVRQSSSGFLQRIARQSVEFETDSEAADSWAQEPADPFEQELQRHARTLQSLQRQLELLQADAQVALL